MPDNELARRSDDPELVPDTFWADDETLIALTTADFERLFTEDD